MDHLLSREIRPVFSQDRPCWSKPNVLRTWVYSSCVASARIKQGEVWKFAVRCTAMTTLDVLQPYYYLNPKQRLNMCLAVVLVGIIKRSANLLHVKLLAVLQFLAAFYLGFRVSCRATARCAAVGIFRVWRKLF